MTVRDILDMFIDGDYQYFELWDVNKEEVVYSGYLFDLSDELEYATVCSIDNVYGDTKGITLNIDMEI